MLRACEQYFDPRGVQAAPDGGVIVRRARAQPPFQLAERRRQDERAQRLRVLALDRAAALHVDVEDDQCVAPLRLEDHRARRAIPVAMDGRPLHELAVLDHGVETSIVDEVVVDAVALAGARRARRVADGEDRPRMRGNQPARKRRLPGS